MSTPHPKAEFIKAWADGKIVQWRGTVGWVDLPQRSPINWEINVEYRIRPQPVEVLKHVAQDGTVYYPNHNFRNANLKLTLENGKLIKAEVLE